MQVSELGLEIKYLVENLEVLSAISPFLYFF